MHPKVRTASTESLGPPPYCCCSRSRGNVFAGGVPLRTDGQAGAGLHHGVNGIVERLGEGLARRGPAGGTNGAGGGGAWASAGAGPVGWFWVARTHGRGGPPGALPPVPAE